MVFKRSAQDETSEYGSDTQTLAEAQLTRPEPPKPAEKPPEERMSLVWRVFGGTILSIVALACITLFNNITSNIAELRSELTRTQAELNRSNAEIRGELNRVHDGRSDVIKKDDFNSRMTTVWDGIKSLQLQNNTQNASLASLKTEQEGVKERSTKAGTDIEVMRKEFAAGIEALKKDQGASNDTIKKDVAALESQKERLTSIALELKALQAESLQVKQQLDRNQAYDQERKESRDRQYKQFDEVVKELQKGTQDCREKLARLEGQVAPPEPRKEKGKEGKEKETVGK